MLISIIVPCFNESDNINKLTQEFLPVVKDLTSGQYVDSQIINQVEVVFIDDGSLNSTYPDLVKAFKSLEEPNLRFLFERHSKNRGLGAALRTGFCTASGEIVITLDSDGTYRYSELPNILACMTSDVDVVTASPYHPHGLVEGVPPFRLFLSRGSSLLYRILLDWHIHTYTSMFRVYRAEVIKNITFDSNGYLAGTELLVKAMLAGFHVVEYPTVLYKRMFGVSKAKIARIIYTHLQFQSKLLLHRMGIVMMVIPEGISKTGHESSLIDYNSR